MLAIPWVLTLVGFVGSIDAPPDLHVIHVEPSAVSRDSRDASSGPDYYVDAGTTSAIERGTRLDVYREVTVVGRELHVRFARLEVIDVFDDTSIARLERIEPQTSGPIVKPRAVMIGDRVVPLPPPEPEPETVESAAVEQRISLPSRVLFAFDSAKLEPAGQAEIRAGFERLATEDGRTLVVEGHSCDLGDEAYNRKLSLRRAETVATFLVDELSVEADRILIRGLGEAAPIRPGTDSVSREANRRVELRVVDEATVTAELK